MTNYFSACNRIIDWLTSEHKAVLTPGTEQHIVIIIGYSILLLLILVHTHMSTGGCIRSSLEDG